MSPSTASYSDGKFRMYNEGIPKHTVKDIDRVISANPADTFPVFSRNGKRDYISTLDTPGQYEKAWIFSDGVAATMKDNNVIRTGKT